MTSVVPLQSFFLLYYLGRRQWTKTLVELISVCLMLNLSHHTVGAPLISVYTQFTPYPQRVQRYTSGVKRNVYNVGVNIILQPTHIVTTRSRGSGWCTYFSQLASTPERQIKLSTAPFSKLNKRCRLDPLSVADPEIFKGGQCISPVVIFLKCTSKYGIKRISEKEYWVN